MISITLLNDILFKIGSEFEMVPQLMAGRKQCFLLREGFYEALFDHAFDVKVVVA
jgi:hypothetical protein